MISFEKATKRYGAKTAPDGLTVRVRGGHVTGLPGPNGAGEHSAGTTMPMADAVGPAVRFGLLTFTAAALFLAEGTVEGYLSGLFLRLGVRNRVEAAILAHQAGIA